SPLIVSSLTPFMTGKSVPRPAIVAMTVAAGGIGVLFQSQLMATTSSLLGGIAILLSVACSGWSALYAKKHTLNVAPVVSTCIQLVVGAMVLLAASAIVENGQSLQWSLKVTLGMFFLAIFGSAVAFATYYWLLRKLHPYQLSTIALIVPIVAIAEGALLLQEPIPPMMLISSIVVLVAVGMVLRAQSDEPVELKLSNANQ
ncbi:MAG: DMT family transporter, partial [Terriglobales bacterium]